MFHFWAIFSELQKPSQTAAERDEAELRILYFKTTWSEFQKPSQTAAERGEAELHLNNYFRLHVCLSIRPSVRPSVRVSHFTILRRITKCQ